MLSLLFGIFLTVSIFACWYVADEIAVASRKTVSGIVLVVLIFIFFLTVLN